MRAIGPETFGCDCDECNAMRLVKKRVRECVAALAAERPGGSEKSIWSGVLGVVVAEMTANRYPFNEIIEDAFQWSRAEMEAERDAEAEGGTLATMQVVGSA